MTTITIPRKLVEEGELVLLPLKEYKELVLSKKPADEFAPTKAQRMALVMAESNFKRGKTLSYHELVKKLGFRD